MHIIPSPTILGFIMIMYGSCFGRGLVKGRFMATVNGTFGSSTVVTCGSKLDSVSAATVDMYILSTRSFKHLT